jgi:hypothetical protein
MTAVDFTLPTASVAAPCNGPVFPAVGMANPALTIQTIAMRTASRIGILARRGEL